jgi:hypothetical protein
MFCREDGSPLHPDDISKRFAVAVAAVDVPRITLHGLRHNWASLALHAGGSPRVVSERLGHASVSFTLDVYSHVMPGMQEDAAARVASLVLDGKGCKMVATGLMRRRRRPQGLTERPHFRGLSQWAVQGSNL